MTGTVFNIQRFSIHDGPGIRTTVFLKGCPLDCFWCHNPESKRPEPELLYSPAQCIGCGRCADVCPTGAQSCDEGLHRLDRALCTRCFRCVDACPSGALERAGRDMTVAEALAEVERDRPFYERSGGGMTVSGGEPLAQYAFTRALLEAARAAGLHTCVDTSGCAPVADLLGLVGLVDLFLWDVKDTDDERHRANTGVSGAPLRDALRAVDAAGGATLLRSALLIGVNAVPEHYERLAALYAELRNCLGVELLAYHELGVGKLERIGREATRRPELRPSDEAMESAREALRSRGVRVIEG